MSAKKKVRVITRKQIDAMIDAAVQQALARQKQQLQGHQQERMLESTRGHLKQLEMERDEERRRRREAEASEDSLRIKIRDLENALKIRSELIEREKQEAYERGRAEERAQGAGGSTQPASAGAEQQPAVNADELMRQMRQTIAEEIAQKLEEATAKNKKISVREKDIILDSLFRDRLETNQAKMTIRQSTGGSVSGALNKLKSFHNGRDDLEIQRETE